ncbi:MAG: hypothetical protein A2103_00485 [Gammaproteobacteria bacterium GWF2_41_13]|nr:MAG: hypothetical protein A2103_00485 [Gammaproteobacteria bacterium GWF2_41_13]
MNNLIKYSIVLPCYQEAENLKVLLPELQETLKQFRQAYEVIIVDTKEPFDDTQQICEHYPQVNYIHRSPGDCYGDAVRTGIQAAQGQWVIFMDADGSHTPAFILRLIEKATTSDNVPDVVIASRYISGGSTDNNFLLVSMSKLLNLIYTKILGIKCLDISNSFRIYRAEQLKNISLTCQHFDVVEEIIYQLMLKDKNLNIVEIPFSFKKRLHGESKRSFFIFLYNYLVTLTTLAARRFLSLMKK